MGGLFAKPNVLKIDAVNEAINKSIIKIADSTTTNINVTNYMEASGGSVIANSQQLADITSNMSSIVSATQKSDFNTSLTNEVGQELSKTTTSLLGAFDGLLQNNNSDLTTKVGQKVENFNITELAPVCALNVDVLNSMIATGGSTITGSSQAIKGQFLQSCITTSDSTMGSISDLTNSLNQRSKFTSENPLNFIGGIMKGGQTMIAVVFIIIVIGLVVMIGPGKLDANALISQGMSMTPQGRMANATQAVVGTPVVAQPVVAQPVVSQPVVSQPVVGTPVVAQPVTK